MNSDLGGWLWLAIDVAFVAVLLAAIAYGTVMWRRRRVSNAARDQATAAVYRAEERREKAQGS